MRACEPADLYQHLLQDAVTQEATPTARAALLIAADRAIWRLLTTPYGHCAHICDAITQPRVLATVVPPAWQHARVWLGQAAPSGSAGVQPAIALTSDSSGSGGTNVIQAPSPLAEVYGSASGSADFGWGHVCQSIGLSSAGIDDTPSAAKPRAVQLTAQLSPYVEEWTVEGTTMCALFCADPHPDLELLA